MERHVACRSRHIDSHKCLCLSLRTFSGSVRRHHSVGVDAAFWHAFVKPRQCFAWLSLGKCADERSVAINVDFNRCVESRALCVGSGGVECHGGFKRAERGGGDCQVAYGSRDIVAYLGHTHVVDGQRPAFFAVAVAVEAQVVISVFINREYHGLFLKFCLLEIWIVLNCFHRRRLWAIADCCFEIFNIFFICRRLGVERQLVAYTFSKGDLRTYSPIVARNIVVVVIVEQ